MKLTAKIESNSYEVNLPVVSPEIIKAYWTDTKGTKISRERLENTVYFHIETKGIPDNSKINLQLFDEDKLTPDDNTFAGKEEKREITIKSNKGSIELYLPLEWTEDLKEEFAKYRKLYWKTTYGNRIKDKKIESFLEIFYSDRTLYVIGSNDKFMLPELYDMGGNELVYTIIEGVHDLAEDSVKDFANKHINRIALAKLEAGNMIDNKGKIHTSTTARGTQRVVSTRTVFTNEGLKIQTVQGRNFTIPNGTTTQGISQIDYFSNYGSKVKFIRLLKHIGRIFDVFEFVDILSSSLKPLDRSKPLSIPFSAANPFVDIAVNVGMSILGMVTQVHFSEMEEALEMDRRHRLEEAKSQGLQAVKKLVDGWKYWNGVEAARTGVLPKGKVEYQIMGISNQTASKIIQGEITKFKEDVQRIEISNYNPDIQILYRRENDTIKGGDKYIIETFFLNT